MISDIASGFFARSPVLVLPLIALGLFMLVFTLTTLRALLGKDAGIEQISRLPLDDDEEDGHGRS